MIEIVCRSRASPCGGGSRARQTGIGPEVVREGVVVVEFGPHALTHHHETVARQFSRLRLRRQLQDRTAELEAVTAHAHPAAATQGDADGYTDGNNKDRAQQIERLEQEAARLQQDLRRGKVDCTFTWRGTARPDDRLELDAAGDSWMLSGDFEVPLTRSLEEAVRRGVPLYFVLEFELIRPRWWWTDETVAERSIVYRLAYPALTRQYRLNFDGTINGFLDPVGAFYGPGYEGPDTGDHNNNGNTTEIVRALTGQTAALATVEDDGRIFVQSSTQHPTETQEIIAHVLGLHSHEVTVQCLRMGGGFGGKEMQPHGYAAVAALGARLTGRPVRLRLNRTQDLTLSGKRHGFHARWRVGFAEDGRLEALEATLTSDGGWSLDLSEPVLGRALCHVDNNYYVPDIRVTGRIARTHKTSQTAFRGFGGPQGMLVLEDILGRCAPLLGIEPHELRRRNFYENGQHTPYGQLITQAERVQQAWDQVTDTGDLERRRSEVARFNATHEHTKRGLAITPVKFGISFNLTAFNQAGALVHVYKDGSVLINHGGTEMGQGLHTKMLQVAATSLGVPLAKVRLAPTRTDKGPNTSATAASSGADLNGGAVKDACEQIKERLAQVAAQRLGVPAPDVRFADGVVSGLGVQETVPWEDVVHSAYFARVQLFAAGYYRTEGLHWNSTVMQGSPFKYFAHGVAATEVEVDGFTGAYRTRRVDIVHDVGDSLSPLVDLGQIEGGYVQGAGWLTLEDLRWDESDGEQRGRLLTQSASTYKLPSFSEMPEELHVTLLERAHEEGAIYGSKAVGEPPLMLAFAMREALRQACAAFGPDGTSVDLASPATPEAVYWAIEAARGRYIAFLDSDDLWLPEKLEKQIRFMEEESVLICYSHYQRMNAEGEPMGVVRTPSSVDYLKMLKSNFIGNLTGIYNAAELGKQYFTDFKHEDYVAWLSLIKRAGTARAVPEVLGLYRVYAGSTSANKLRALSWQWRIYRLSESLNFFESCRLMVYYGNYALSKRRS